jgi:hypothetical protein
LGSVLLKKSSVITLGRFACNNDSKNRRKMNH